MCRPALRAFAPRLTPAFLILVEIADERASGQVPLDCREARSSSACPNAVTFPTSKVDSPARGFDRFVAERLARRTRQMIAGPELIGLFASQFSRSVGA